MFEGVKPISWPSSSYSPLPVSDPTSANDPASVSRSMRSRIVRRPSECWRATPSSPPCSSTSARRAASSRSSASHADAGSCPGCVRRAVVHGHRRSSRRRRAAAPAPDDDVSPTPPTRTRRQPPSGIRLSGSAPNRTVLPAVRTADGPADVALAERSTASAPDAASVDGQVERRPEAGRRQAQRDTRASGVLGASEPLRAACCRACGGAAPRAWCAAWPGRR